MESQPKPIHLNREQRARRRAQEICADFTYIHVAKASEENGGVDVWRCRGSDMDQSHDLVITPMGISAFGDMDPLVFRTPGRGLSLLASSDVSSYLFSKLDCDFRQKTPDLELLFDRLASDIYDHAMVEWEGIEIEGEMATHLNALKDGPRHESGKVLKAFARQLLLERDDPRWAVLTESGRPSSAHPAEFGEHLSMVVDELECAGITMDEIHRALSESSDDFMGMFRDLDASYFSSPSEAVLLRLHILNIGAQRMLAQLEQDAPAVLQPERPRG